MAWRKRSNGLRDGWHGEPASPPEIEEVTDKLCSMLQRGKDKKVDEEFSAWLGEVGLGGAALLTVFVTLRVAEGMARRGIPLSAFDGRGPNVPNVTPEEWIMATLTAQTLVERALRRFAAGEDETPTGEEIAEVWKVQEEGALTVRYLLQCLATVRRYDAEDAKRRARSRP